MAKALPLVHIFEEMRNILINQTANLSNLIISILLSIGYFAFGIIVFYISYYGAKKKGTLINIGE